MILDYDCATGDTARFTKEDHRIVSVMEHIDEHHDVDAGIVSGNHLTVKALYWDMLIGSNQNIDAAQVKIRSLLQNEMRQPAVSAADVEHAGVARHEFGEVSTENQSSSF